ncbi:protein transport protein SEC24 [Nematocida minor]|uniref:protein transport protein SEC24 n=1 Tax=Nematocida minor TaxID=1912983 RepID=UPI0022208F5A|nr:protein transport protein SEC24 [Nematocida minor]KAI5190723.1 protein transport protein SEC24 [Nematocida minor]
MFTQPHDKEVFRDSAFNRTNNVPSLSSKIQQTTDKIDKHAREQEVFSRLPSIPDIIEQDRNRREPRISPPLSINSDIPYDADPSSSSQSLVRSTMYVVPADEDLFELVGLPFLVVLQPFNDAVPVPEYKTAYLSRCKECSSFPTPSENVSFQYKCTMCGTMNEIQPECPSLQEHTTEYVCEGDALKNGRSWYSSDNIPKSEISLPSCRKWNEPSVIFMIDCTTVSRGSPGYSEYIDGLRTILASSELSLFYRRVGILLINDAVSVVSDSELGYSVNVIYSVKGDYGLCAPLFIETDSLTEERVNTLMETIETHSNISSGSFNVPGALIAAIQMTAYTGGSKTIAWLGSGEYADVPEPLHQTMIDCGVSLHVFTSRSSKIDKMHNTVFTTGGSVERDQITSGMMGKVLQESYFRCSIRVVSSNGIKKRAVYCSGSSENISTVSFPGMDSSTSLAVSFSVEDFLKEGIPVYIQAIVEYVNLSGEGRVRIINMKLRASRLIQQIFSGLSMDTLFCGMCKYICSEPVKIVDNVRKAESSMISALSLYKRACAKDTSPTQLVLPDSIKGLPVLIQSILKYPRIQLGVGMRAELAGEIMPLSVDRTFRMFYPRLVKISSLFTVGRIDDLPGERLSMRTLDDNESYLMDAGGKCILWFGKGAVDYMDEMVENEVVLSALERLKEMYGVDLKVTQCIQGEMDADFIGYMIEDQMGGYPKYQEYLGFLHGKIVKK